MYTLFKQKQKMQTNIKFELAKMFQLITLPFFKKEPHKNNVSLGCIDINCNFKRLRLHSSISILKPKHLNTNKEIKI